MDYKVGWICALEKELAVSEAMLDDVHEPLPTASNDANTYTLGRIGSHNIVMACLPAGQYGLNNASIVGVNMLRTFQFIEKRLLVGIGGGIPDSIDIRLGDVVVSDQVIQYDLGKTMPGQQLHRTSLPARPPQVLMTAVSSLQAKHRMVPSEIPALIADMLGRHSPMMSEYSRAQTPDDLFEYSYDHVSEGSNHDCRNCDPTKRVVRSDRRSANPVIHFGSVASGNQVIKDGSMRRKLSGELGVICFEMEAAGLMADLSCLVIRGICDYSDSHKNKQWQEYAAATAAAYAKELLLSISLTTPESSQWDETPEALRRFWLWLPSSLKFAEMPSRYNDIKPALPDTCEWFLTEKVYLDWLDMAQYKDHHGFLWISGKPGAGKSTMMKFLYSHAKETQNEGHDIAVVAFFFTARGVELEKSTAGLYRSLLLQIISIFRDLPMPPDLDKLQDEEEKGGSAIWTLPVLQNLFQHIVENLGQRKLICFIDALDECDENQVWTMIDLLQDLGNIASRNSKRFHVCLSSRHYPRVEIQPCLRQTLEHQKGHTKDIEKYVRSKLVRRDTKAVEDVIGLILDKASGVFFWVVLVVQMLRKEFSRGDILVIKNRIQDLPSDLSKLFRGMVSRDDEGMEDFLLSIQWILFASRPLTGREFFFALHSGQHRQKLESLQGWDSELLSDADMEHFVSSTSKGLAEITTSKNPTVQFIHESVRDFLLKDGGIQQLWPQYEQVPLFEALSHDCLKTCCAFVLRMDVSTALLPLERTSMGRKLVSGEVRERIQAKFPFLRYAVSNLFHHSNSSAPVVSQAEFLEEVDFASWVTLHTHCQGGRDTIYSTDVSKAYVFSANNWVELLGLALQSDQNIVSPEEEFSHPLIVASAKGHEPAVRLLLATKGMDFQPQDSLGRTPLWCAILNDHDKVFDLLLEHQGSEAALADHRGRTPLTIACQLLRLSMMKKLIDADLRLAAIRPRHDMTVLAEFVYLGFNIEDLILAGEAIAHVKNAQGKTTLQVVIDQDRYRLLHYLLQLPGSATSDPNSTTSLARGYALLIGKMHMVHKYALWYPTRTRGTQ